MASNPAPTYITPPTASRIIGCRVETIHAWIRSGELTASNLAKPGAKRPSYKIHISDLDAFMASRRVCPPPPKRAKQAGLPKPSRREWV